MVACPYNVPEYDYNNPFGALHKCELCNQKGVERLDKGGSGCVEVCPAGAVIFGTREELMAEAKKRLALKPGSEYHYPRQTLKIWRHLPAYRVRNIIRICTAKKRAAVLRFWY